jgi:hypothetical protein
MKLTSDERNVGARRHLIEMLLSDSERQLVANSTTSSALGTRAAILVASASIATGLQLAKSDDAGWYLLALIATGLAALSGITVLLPRRSREVVLVDLEELSWNETDSVASRRLLYSRLDILRRDKTALRWRAIVLLVGFAILFAGIACACLQLANVPAPIDWKSS